MSEIHLANGDVLHFVQQIEDSINNRAEPRWVQNNIDHERIFTALDSIQRSISSIETSIAGLNTNQENISSNVKKLEEKLIITDGTASHKTLSWSQVYFNGVMIILGSFIGIYGYNTIFR